MNCEGTILVSLESTEDELPTKGAYFRSTGKQDVEEAYFQSAESEEELTCCSTMAKVSSALEVLQPISLILNPHFGWNGWIGKGAYLFLLGFLWDPELYNLPEPPARAAFWVASGMVLMSSFVTFFTTTDRNPLIYVIREVAVPASFPVMQMFLSRIVCNGDGRLWLYPAEECFTFSHMVEGAVGCFCFGLLCFMCLGFAMGNHIDISVLLFKVVSSLCFHFLLSKNMIEELSLLLIVLPLCVAGYIVFVANVSSIAAAKEQLLLFMNGDNKQITIS
eukprot:TRINITY_DN3610_c0_g1_i1.p1 TRINITY_DN3610_c0_g1~~TRINITY_DN3610_c0_g1_i1.p1  ORF type:complete len:277 (+),score=44.71 TRINITY_DN3610_c0_g1_i1:69-899(+)